MEKYYRIQGERGVYILSQGEMDTALDREMDREQIIKEYMAQIAREGHKKSPRGKEFYQNMARKSWENRPHKTPNGTGKTENPLTLENN